MSISIDENKECEGCQTVYVGKGIEMCIGTELDNCPCMHCLIKVICKNCCEDLLAHIKRAEDRRIIKGR